MYPHPRYEILTQIAAGDFATVFRARDKELNREVAIKQIHPQFLADQRQLERYWQEAQLLASLEHPNIMTMYDVDRSRGWLILELMTGSLSDMADGQPIDLEFLRVALVCSLQALKFLHQNGIVHGDVKPTNLMVDRRNWVKLGDFGLAQRASDDQGSVLKGTTKYIAPERVSDQFGPVGPASDLYSLGFSMYQLMCGDHFDSLFPGLNAFGRDKQIAWIMWHAAADRPAPEISRVLEGVPEGLAQVIQRMICKDPAQRYSSAEEVLADVKAGMGYSQKGPTEEELAAAAEEEHKKRRRKILLRVAAGLGILLSAIMLWPKDEPPKPVARLKGTQGVVQHIHVGKLDSAPIVPDSIVLKTDRDLVTVNIRPADQLYLNDQSAQFSAIKEGDRVRVRVYEGNPGQQLQEIRVSRPSVDQGEIVAVHPYQSTFVMTTAGEGAVKERKLLVPETVEISFNGKTPTGDDALTVEDLKEGDKVEVEHDAEDDHRIVLKLSVVRVVSVRGKAQGVDEKANTLTLTKEGTNKRLSLRLSGRCEVVINGRQFIRSKPLMPRDIRQGDLLEVFHDTHVVKIVAERFVKRAGTVKSINAAGRTLQVKLDDNAAAETTVQLGKQCSFQLGDEKVAFDELQSGDKVSVHVDAADPEEMVALKIDAQRPVRRDRWAVVITIQDYQDPALTRLPHLSEGGRQLKNSLLQRYAVAQDQLLILEDPIEASLTSSLGDFLKRIPDTGQLVVYCGGHVYEDDGVPYLALADFKLLEIRSSGMPLASFVQMIEACDAGDKVLLMDTCHSGSGLDLRRQPSATEQIAAVNTDPRSPALRTARAITNSSDGQRGMVVDGQGVFVMALAKAFTGKANQDEDTLLESDELLAFVNDSVRSATDGQQTPGVVEPQQPVGPRLSEEAQAELRKLAVFLSEEKISTDDARQTMQKAEDAATGQPEPGLLMGLILLKAGEPDAAVTTFRAVLKKHPDQLLPVQGMIWGLYRDKEYKRAVDGLVRLVATVPKEVSSDGELKGQSRQIIHWVGRLREFAGRAAAERKQPAQTALEAVDQVVASSGLAAKRAYSAGRSHVRRKVEEFDRQIDRAFTPAERLNLERRKRALQAYVSFSIEAAAQQVLDGMSD